MSFIERKQDLKDLLDKKSHFFFGARGSGKSHLIREKLAHVKSYNLLETDTFARLSAKPSLIRSELSEDTTSIVIDEVQKLPSLLDEVHLLIEEKGINFLLTGSSARKLKRTKANLLGGRARVRHLYPFSWSELGDKFSLQKALQFGLLPSIYFSEDPDDDLLSYVGTYLQEEIAAEAVTRNIPAFARFLEVAALNSAQMINFQNVSSDAQVKYSTTRDYYQILEDTLIGFNLPAWKSSKRKTISTGKFYLFDTGIVRILSKRKTLERNSTEFGIALETFLYHEIRCFNEYIHKGKLQINYWRTKSNFEVDFVLDDKIAIEIKSTDQVNDKHLKGLRAILEEAEFKRAILVSLDPVRKTYGKIEALPLYEFLSELWAGNII
jgi:predicted AAA+ superfamily ATPase